MRLYFLFTVILYLTLIGCSSMNEKYESKLDSGLKLKLKNSLDEKIEFFGKCKVDISEEIRSERESTGVNIQTISKDIFTASGLSDQIIKLAKLNVVKYLEASQRRNFQNY